LLLAEDALMQLAFVLYKYFPFGGLQRDFMRIALECQKRGHQIRVYTLIWEGDIPPGFEVLVAPVKAFFNHRRNEKLSAWMAADLAKRPVDRLIGFNKMPGLDVYYAADGCFEDKAQTLRGGCTAAGAATATSPSTSARCSPRTPTPKC
jgi:UDP-glucose:(heptosyl)LPS alpha-1,3-glucosyltransferase